MNYELPTTSYANRLSSPACQKVLEIRFITLFLCALVPLWLKNPFNQRNPRLMKYLRAYYLCAYKALHLSRTLYKSALFMQNKANFLDALMNVKSIHTVVYKNKSNWKLGENKANTKPIKANFRKAEMNVTSILTKDYKNVPLRRRGENKPNLSRRSLWRSPIKPNLKILPQRVRRTRAGQAGHTRSCFGHFSKVVILFAE